MPQSTKPASIPKPQILVETLTVTLVVLLNPESL